MSDHTLALADNATRVRIVTPNANSQFTVGVGDPALAWLPGTFIEILNATADSLVTLVPEGLATLNFFEGDILTPGQYARVTLNDQGEWDVHTHTHSIHKPRPLTTYAIPASTMDFGSSLHHNMHVRATSTVPNTITVRPDSFFTGTQAYWEQGGDPAAPGPMPIGGSALFGVHGLGAVTFVAAPGVTINYPDTLVMSKLHAKCTLVKVAANTWDLEGHLDAV
jgi:hypothetical protein